MYEDEEGRRVVKMCPPQSAKKTSESDTEEVFREKKMKSVLNKYKVVLQFLHFNSGSRFNSDITYDLCDEHYLMTQIPMSKKVT